jgi:hypothetical protein
MITTEHRPAVGLCRLEQKVGIAASFPGDAATMELHLSADACLGFGKQAERNEDNARGKSGAV